jgi:hypothetical protein
LTGPKDYQLTKSLNQNSWTKQQPLTKYLKHAGTVDFNLLFWGAGTFYIQTLGAILMETSKSIELLKNQVEKAEPLKRDKDFSPCFKKWRRDTEIVIEKIFGKDSRHLRDFDGISYSLSAFSTATPDYVFQQRFVEGLVEAQQILNSMIDEINEFGFDGQNESLEGDSLTVIENVCNRFHLVARQLRSRHSSRATIEIEDEYDVQDLFHSLLHLHFDDIRPEEWTPSYAGGSSRMDFLLKQEQIIVEIKKTRKSLTTKDIADQLIIDATRYQSHPDCKCLICFVYDPEGRIGNPTGLETDLTDKKNELRTIVIVSPKGT